MAGIAGRPWQRLPVPVQDAVLAVAVALFQLRGTALVTPGQLDVRPLSQPSALGYVLLAASALVLAVRRRRPAAVLAAVAVLDAVYYVAGYPDGPGWVALFVALYTLTAHGDGHRSVRAATATVAALTAVWLLTADVWPLNGAGWVFFRIGAAVMAAALGESVRGHRALATEARERAERAERTREDEARRRADAERLRIARDVHDTVAHALALINVQAGVTAHVLDRRPEAAREALRTIERTSADALVGPAGDARGVARRHRRRPPARPAPPASTSSTGWPRPPARPGWWSGWTWTARRGRCRPASTTPPTGSSRSRSPTRCATPGRRRSR